MAARWWMLAALLPAICWLLLRNQAERSPTTRADLAPAERSRTQADAPRLPAEFVGSAACEKCHAQEYTAWRGSQHARAMQEPTDATVLGNFDDARIAYAGKLHRFTHEGGKYWVTTEGPDGVFRKYQVLYTFGVEPLQQYLVSAARGRLQALPFAWDSRRKSEGGQRWYHLQGEEKVSAGDVLHWTAPSHNWNHMCAECHSTRVIKNYQPESDSFRTTWSELSVGCEGCHGGAGHHLEWAKNPDAREPSKGFDTSFHERKNPTFRTLPGGTTMRTKASSSGREASACALCHSRRETLAQPLRHGAPLLDSVVPELLLPSAYAADGVMQDEVFTYGSFVQSKMAAAGVSCSDCHDPHSGTLRADGNALCTQCHEAARFDDVGHHRHASGTSGSRCIDCHMPARTYMGIDVRHDHGFRVPRPDLSVAHGLPNTCTDCHSDRRPEWAAREVERWLGRPARSAQGYAAVFARARAGAGVPSELKAIATDRAVPAIARATAVWHLRDAQPRESLATLRAALADPEPLLRRAALGALEAYEPRSRAPLAAPLLADPVLAVRIEAARVLAAVDPASMSGESPDSLHRALHEYVATQALNADRAEAQNNLGILWSHRGEARAAEAAFEAALRVEPSYSATYVNLADLRRVTGRDVEGLALLSSARARLPENAEILHALGLALVRQGRKGEALEPLRRAALLAPSNTRFAYVYDTARAELGPRRP